MNGLFFEDQVPVVASAPNRADIACFVGLIGRRNTTIPSDVWRWLCEQGWTTPPYGWAGPLLFRVDGLKKLKELVIKLRAAQDPLSKFLQEQVERITPRLLESYDDSLPPSAALERTLVSTLNGLLEADDFYAKERFQNVQLNAETQSLVQEGVQGAELMRLNRLLLEQAYPEEIYSLEQAGPSPDYLPEAARDQYTSIDDLLDIPVPVDNWEVFDRLFAWDRRDVDGRGQTCPTYMGAAVRSFFAQGGRKCYVVRVGDPLPLTASRDLRLERIEKLIPGYPHRLTPSPVDRRSWRAVGHLFGLPETSFLCLPDLADLLGVEREPVSLPEYIAPHEEQFVECSEEILQEEPKDRLARLFPAPRCDEEGYREWTRALWLTVNMISRQQREVQLVAAVPIPQRGILAEEDLLGFLLNSQDGVNQGGGPLAAAPAHQSDGIASAFLQLAYPWMRTSGSLNLPEQIESPDAVLVGILARNALTRGTFRSSASLHLSDVYDVYPPLRRHQMIRLPSASPMSSVTNRNLLERVSLFGRTPNGLRLLSDVTTSLDESYRPASVNRLVSIIVRAARSLGEEIVFEASGERLWVQLRERLNGLLAGLLAAGALRGTIPAEAFQVRCDRSTMSQNDIDNGRVIAYVQFDAAAPIERITVVLSMDEGGQVSLLSTANASQEAA